MTGGIRIGKLFGFELRLDVSWFIVFFLVIWTFAEQVFPQRHPGLSTQTYILMALAGAILFFASVLLHEIAHSAVARALGIEVEGITLFIFGGMARIRSEATRPRDEFLITVVGPLSSAAIGLALLAFARVGGARGLPVSVTGVAGYLALLNFVLAGFNLIPGFPLDGGRLFRSVVWQLTGDLRKATRWATLTGRIFGFLLVGLGLLQIFGGHLVGGIWFIFIGWFLAQAAESSYRQLILRRILEGVQARDAMTRNPETVHASLTLDELVSEYFLTRTYSAFPVEDEYGGLLGLITLSQVKSIDRDQWPVTRVRDVMMKLGEAPTVRPEDSLALALSEMERLGLGRVLVIDRAVLLGVITRADVAKWLERYQTLR